MNAKNWILLAAVGLSACDANSTLAYGDSGLPKNCRAIIKGNIDGWRSKKFTAEQALSSIDRNCGEYGHSWR